MSERAGKAGGKSGSGGGGCRAGGNGNTEVGSRVDSSWDIRIDDNIVDRNIGEVRGSWSRAIGRRNNRTAHVFPGIAAIGRFKDVAGWIVNAKTCIHKAKARERDVSSFSRIIPGIDRDGQEGAGRKASLSADLKEACEVPWRNVGGDKN